MLGLDSGDGMKQGSLGVKVACTWVEQVARKVVGFQPKILTYPQLMPRVTLLGTLPLFYHYRH